MTINFTITRKGVNYDLGYIHQTIIEGKQMFVLLPSFPARPPFAYPMLKGAQNRLHALADFAFESKIKVPKVGEKTFTGVVRYSY